MAEPSLLAWSELSSSTQAAFQYAAGLAAPPDANASQSSATGVPEVSSRMLLIGIADAHPDPAGANPNPLLDLLAHSSLGRVDLDAELAAHWRGTGTSYDPAGRRRLTLVDLPPMKGHTPQVLQAAADLMNRVTDRPSRLPLRFLFGGMLVVTESGAFQTLESLLGHRVDLDAIRGAYSEYLNLPDRVRFADFLGDRFPTTAPFAGTVADRTVGEDLLGRGKLIGDVARWLSIRNLQTPLAIGLFGDWGSGKSFFMARLQEEIERISLRARNRTRESAFCPHVVQVNFNAWLYSDSEIWPSLASQVFKAAAGIDPDAPGAGSLEDLRNYWATKSSAYQAAEEDTKKAAEREANAQQSVQQLDEETRAAHKRLVDQAGEFGPEAKRLVEAGQSLTAAVSTSKRAASVLKGLSTKSKLALGGLILVGIVAAIVWALDPSLVAKVVTLVGLVTPVAGVVVRFASATATAGKEFQTQQDLRKETQEAERELQDATEARKAAEVRLNKLAGIGPLDAYASGQAELWTAREKLGEVTEIRQAFAKLSSIITLTQQERQARAEGNGDHTDVEAGKEGEPTVRPPIDRIVVYIDDLDRCPPDLVVKVLEAIKLLMDLEHFVVVVGVDSRWLFRSLEIKFSELLSDDGATDADGSWMATPQNYLEKIFQFSLMLPPITKEGYERLVMALFGADTASEDDDEREPVDTGSADHAPAGAGSSEPEGTAHAPQAPRSEDDDRPADLLLRTEELQTIQALAPLIQTPRSAKRLTNIYRLLRVTYGESNLLKDDSYVVVLSLLGIIVGYPRQSSAVLDHLDGSDATTQWSAFLEDLKPKRTPDGAAAPYRNAARGGMSEAEAEEWARMCRDLLEITANRQWDLGTSAFRNWLEPVAEYTFHPWRRGVTFDEMTEAEGRQQPAPDGQPAAGAEHPAPDGKGKPTATRSRSRAPARASRS